MRKSLVPMSIAAIAVFGGIALAAAGTATGTISSIDTAKHQLRLTNGETFVLPASWKDSYKVGDKVLVSYEMKNGVMDATNISAAR